MVVDSVSTVLLVESSCLVDSGGVVDTADLISPYLFEDLFQDVFTKLVMLRNLLHIGAPRKFKRL